MSDVDDSFDASGFGFADIDPRAYEEEQLAAAIAASLADVSVDAHAGSISADLDVVSKAADVIYIDSSSSATSERSSQEPAGPRSSSLNKASSVARPNLASADAKTSNLATESSISRPVFMNERAEMERARLERQKRRREEEEAMLGPASQTPGAGPSTRPAPGGRERDDGLGVQRATKIL